VSRLLTVSEAAGELGRSQDFIRGLIRRGRVVSMRINGRYYVPEWSLEDLLRPARPTTAAFAQEIKPRRGARAGQSAAGSAPAGGARNVA
jgi:hypothetical protein